jgi:hypothetical protein
MRGQELTWLLPLLLDKTAQILPLRGELLNPAANRADPEPPALVKTQGNRPAQLRRGILETGEGTAKAPSPVLGAAPGKQGFIVKEGESGVAALSGPAER